MRASALATRGGAIAAAVGALLLAAAPTAAAPVQVSASSLRDGMRMRLFGEARLIP